MRVDDFQGLSCQTARSLPSRKASKFVSLGPYIANTPEPYEAYKCHLYSACSSGFLNVTEKGKLGPEGVM